MGTARAWIHENVAVDERAKLMATIVKREPRPAEPVTQWPWLSVMRPFSSVASTRTKSIE